MNDDDFSERKTKEANNPRAITISEVIEEIQTFEGAHDFHDLTLSGSQWSSKLMYLKKA